MSLKAAFKPNRSTIIRELREIVSRNPVPFMNIGFINRLLFTSQPFRPLGIGNEKEKIYAHTIKDFKVASAILDNHPEEKILSSVIFRPNTLLISSMMKNRYPRM